MEEVSDVKLELEEVKVDLNEDAKESSENEILRFCLERMYTRNQLSWSEFKPKLALMDLKDLETLNQKGRSALHFAVRYSHNDLVRYLLLERSVSHETVGEEGMAPIHYICRYGRIDVEAVAETLEILLEAGVDINKGDTYKYTPLHHATTRGNLTLIEMLLNREEIDVNAKDIQGNTPLLVAANYNQLDVFKALRKAGADLMLLNEMGQSVLHRAAQEGRWELVENILTRCDDDQDEKDEETLIELRQTLIQMKDKDGNNPVFLATMAGSRKGVAKFLKLAFERSGTYGMINETNNQEECCLHFAARSGDPDIVKVLLDYEADINQKNFSGQTPLSLAAENICPVVVLPEILSVIMRSESRSCKSDLSVVKLLVERGADLNIANHEGLTPIMIAAKKGHVAVVKYLMEQSASLVERDMNDQSILHLCAKYDQFEVLNELLEGEEGELVAKINDCDHMENSPLHVAANEGHLDTVKLLLRKEYGADIDQQNWDEEKAIHLAAYKGHYDVLGLLLQHDPNGIFDRDEDENTPLHLAAEGGHPEAVELLLAAGASVIKRNRKEWTPLDSAAVAGEVKCCKILVDSGSELDHTDRGRQTSLHLAAIHGHHNVVEFLLSRGSSIDMKNREGKNALELAIIEGHTNVVSVVIDSSQWQNALRTVHTKTNRHGELVPNTPIRMLIKKFPDLAEKVFDKCIDNRETEVEMDYTFLNDTYCLEKVKVNNKEVFKYKNTKETMDFTTYDGNGVASMDNHPLMLMVENKNKDLLRHPLCLALLRRKWREFGAWVFYFQLFSYILYLISINCYTLMNLKTNLADPETYPNLPFRGAVIFTVFLGCFIEISQIIRMKTRYFCCSNLMDWTLYCLSLIFACASMPISSKWPIGAFLVIMAWINLLSHIRYFPFFGIYILMFTHIFKTVAKFSVILVIFIVAFGLGFHIVFVNQMAFGSTSYSLLKTYVMMIGEYEFDDIFKGHVSPSENATEKELGDNNVPFPTFSAILFAFFVAVMTIIIMNLLTGLAVDDISEIQNNAEQEKLSLNTILVLESERFLPHLRCCLTNEFLKKYTCNKETISKGPNYWILQDVLSKRTILDSLEKRLEEKQVNRKTDMEQMIEHQRKMAVMVHNLTEQVESLQDNGRNRSRNRKGW